MTTDSLILSTIRLNAAHDIFKGHFPGHPVLPGVCMMEMIEEITGKFLQQSFRISGVPLIKFLRMIDPYKNPTLSVEINYQSAAEHMATNGKIYSGSEIFMKFQLILLPDPV
jgi:3-hydroxyacyl-[acyl-carrier-protein] dehydratase